MSSELYGMLGIFCAATISVQREMPFKNTIVIRHIKRISLVVSVSYTMFTIDIQVFALRY